MSLLVKEEEILRTDETSKKIEDMNTRELEEAHWGVDEERKLFCRARRGKEWTEEDKYIYESMNAYAQKLMDERLRRGKSA